MRLCVVQPTPAKFSETFLTAQSERLPADVRVIYAESERFRLFGRRPRTKPKKPRYFRRTLRALRPSAVLAQYGPIGIQVMEACAEAEIPLIVHFHGYDVSREWVLLEFGQRYPRLFEQAVAVVAVSRRMEQDLVALGAPPEKVHYNPCGVDCRRFAATRPSVAPPTLLAVGRFVEKKGPLLTILAFAELHRQCPQARLRMIGEGDMLEFCEKTARVLRIEDAVDFLGIQLPQFVQAEMQVARCFVQHSVVASDGDSEGTPVSVLEAGASGLPIVATRHAGIPDVVIDGKTGFLVDERDVTAMAERMKRFVEDPDLAERMGSVARSHVQTHFSIGARTAGLWRIIETAVAGATAKRQSDQDPQRAIHAA